MPESYRRRGSSDSRMPSSISTNYQPLSSNVAPYRNLRGDETLAGPIQPTFTVFRPDPTRSTLEPISSSSVHRGNHPSPLMRHDSAGAVNGSVPIFSVHLSENPSVRVPRTQVDPRFPAQPALAHQFPGALEGSLITFSSVGGPATSGRLGVPGEVNHGPTSDGRSFPVDPTKRHVCPTCSKRFNRPSSLKIHVNTHTGATPFRCPMPDCGREFNVNSNMKRHYRQHSHDVRGTARSSSRRRRRAASDGKGSASAATTSGAGLSAAFPLSMASLPSSSSSAASDDGSFEEDELMEDDSSLDDATSRCEEDNHRFRQVTMRHLSPASHCSSSPSTISTESTMSSSRSPSSSPCPVHLSCLTLRPVYGVEAHAHSKSPASRYVSIKNEDEDLRM
ncbi:hypothetical protein HGRIS_008919 [Hohenbuehelia grisea]|uniref:C2H2-type domain-containing protein n=1 Tax=Hohenbuehelia grisea TaxID=104357 RepID=A0ABR3IZP5_9AGAR